MSDTDTTPVVTVRRIDQGYGLRPTEPYDFYPNETATGFDGWNGRITVESGDSYPNGEYLVISGNVHALPDTRTTY